MILIFPHRYEQELNQRTNNENDFVILKKVRHRGTQGGLWAQEAEQSEDFLWDVV